MYRLVWANRSCDVGSYIEESAEDEETGASDEKEEGSALFGGHGYETLSSESIAAHRSLDGPSVRDSDALRRGIFKSSLTDRACERRLLRSMHASESLRTHRLHEACATTHTT